MPHSILKKCARFAVLSVLETVSLLLVLALVPVRAARKIFLRKDFLSLWTGTPIITMAFNALSERLLGYRSKSLVTHTYYITDAFDYDLSALGSIRLLRPLVPFGVFVWACLFVDRLHFYCDRGILPPRRAFTFNFLELYVYRALGIQVFLWTYGADVRSRDITLMLGKPNCCTDCTLVGIACICDEQARAAKIKKLREFSVAIFSMGDMIEYTPGSRNDLFFWPVDLGARNGDKYRPVFPRFDEPRSLRIVHASNHRMFKGTRFLEKAVEELRSEGVPVELVLVEKIPNEQALEIYRSADIIFDQCLIGFHGYFALEGMALGKPVMCFIRKPAEYLLHPEECPIINTHVSTLKEDIRRLVEKRDELAEIGMRGQKYIKKYFTKEAFSKRLGQAYKELGVVP